MGPPAPGSAPSPPAWSPAARSGNLGDRAFRGDAGFLHGAVVDFIDLQWWPIFNVADSAIVVGGILLVIVSMLTPVDEPA